MYSRGEHTHTHNRFTALWKLSGTTRVSRYQKKHSPTTLIVVINHPYLLSPSTTNDTWHPPYSIHVLYSLFPVEGNCRRNLSFTLSRVKFLYYVRQERLYQNLGLLRDWSILLSYAKLSKWVVHLGLLSVPLLNSIAWDRL